MNAALALTDIASADLPGFDPQQFPPGLACGWGVKLGECLMAVLPLPVPPRLIETRTLQHLPWPAIATKFGLRLKSPYFSLEANLSNIDTARTALEQTREALRLAQRRFDAGVGDQLEVTHRPAGTYRSPGEFVRGGYWAITAPWLTWNGPYRILAEVSLNLQ